METLNCYSQSNIILQKNLDAANQFNLFELAMGIGEIYHRNNPVTKWADRNEEQRLNIFSDYDCYGANCGTNKSSGFEIHSTSNPNMIHLKGCAVQIDPINKTVNFIHGDSFGTPKFYGSDLVELNELITKHGFNFGVSNSILVGA